MNFDDICIMWVLGRWPRTLVTLLSDPFPNEKIVPQELRDAVPRLLKKSAFPLRFSRKMMRIIGDTVLFWTDVYYVK